MSKILSRLCLHVIFEMDLNETRKNLDACLNDEQRKEYFALLRQWFSFKSPITKKEFDTKVRSLLVNEDQIRCHNHFMLALLSKPMTSKVKNSRNTSDKDVFECADFNDYIQPSSPSMLPPSEYENRSAAAELFMPDSSFIAMRIAMAAWENGLDGASDKVTEILVNACQMFVKNIITAMITRKKGYKLRDKRFQYGFNSPIPDPFIRNFANVTDDTQEYKVEVERDEETFIPRSKPSLENIEQETAFAYACSKRLKSDNLLTVRLLYETLKEKPELLGAHDLRSINLLKLSLQLDNTAL